jgi:hypothetical protein
VGGVGPIFQPIQAIVVTPGAPPGAELADVVEPLRGPDELLIEMIALGVCGTDSEIVAGECGWAPPGGTPWSLDTSRSGGAGSAARRRRVPIDRWADA